MFGRPGGAVDQAQVSQARCMLQLFEFSPSPDTYFEQFTFQIIIDLLFTCLKFWGGFDPCSAIYVGSSHLCASGSFLAVLKEPVVTGIEPGLTACRQAP